MTVVTANSASSLYAQGVPIGRLLFIKCKFFFSDTEFFTNYREYLLAKDEKLREQYNSIYLDLNH